MAQLLLLKDRLMAEGAKPAQLLRTFPSMDAKKVVELSVWICGRLPEGLFGEIVRHGFAAGEEGGGS